MTEKVERTEAEWRELLDDQRYHVLREAGTERPWTGALLQNKDTGVYMCGACGAELFASDSKFDSGSGWPSFTEALERGVVDERTDQSHGMTRTEVLCATCGSHLGHVFPDGPGPTGMRYCINSLALDFKGNDES